MKKILVPIDGSDSAKKAAEQAVSLAKVYQSAITFITVVEVKQYYYYDLNGVPMDDIMAVRDNLTKLDIENSEKMLCEFVKTLECDELKVDTAVRVGDPHPEIVQYAKKGEYDMIVIGHRGMNPFQRLFIGSVAKRVIEDAPCSVLVVK